MECNNSKLFKLTLTVRKISDYSEFHFYFSVLKEIPNKHIWFESQDTVLIEGCEGI